MMRTEGSGVLEGLKVVEFAHVIAGPLAGTLMADHGAEVIHVEAPNGGDTGRYMGPKKDGTYLWWKVSGRNKRSVSIDLRTEAGQDIAHKLVKWADVVITNLRIPTLRKWRLDWESVRAENNKIIYLQITGFGATSSKSDAPGFGKVGEARSGVAHITGMPDGPPIHTGFSHGDSVTGLMGAFAALAAVYRKKVDPDFQGEWIDLALFEPLFRLIEWQVIVRDQLGWTPNRTGNKLSVAPAAVINTYESGDGDWIVVTSATVKSVLNVVRLLGFDPDEFATREAQEIRADELDRELSIWMRGRSTDDCLEKLENAEVVASKIFTVDDIMKDPIYQERRNIVEMEDEDFGRIRMQAAIPHFRLKPGAVWRAGAKLGADNEYVLSGLLKMNSERIKVLKDTGVVG